VRFCLRMFVIRGISGRAADEGKLLHYQQGRILVLIPWKSGKLIPFARGNSFLLRDNSRRLDGNQIIPLLGIWIALERARMQVPAGFLNELAT